MPDEQRAIGQSASQEFPLGTTFFLGRRPRPRRWRPRRISPCPLFVSRPCRQPIAVLDPFFLRCSEPTLAVASVALRSLPRWMSRATPCRAGPRHAAGKSREKSFSWREARARACTHAGRATRRGTGEWTLDRSASPVATRPQAPRLDSTRLDLISTRLRNAARTHARAAHASEHGRWSTAR